MNIIVNARIKGLPDEYRSLTYDEVVVLAYGPTDRDAVHTVTYFHPKGPKGSLVSGAKVRLKKNMVFTCVQTNKA